MEDKRRHEEDKKRLGLGFWMISHEVGAVTMRADQNTHE